MLTLTQTIFPSETDIAFMRHFPIRPTGESIIHQIFKCYKFGRMGPGRNMAIVAKHIAKNLINPT
jgi:hypothetical protein